MQGYELDFIADFVEEKIVRGDLRWLANFNEIRRNYVVDDIVFTIYASGGLQERGFLLSRIFSAFVTPRYRVHLFLYTSQRIDTKFLRKLILALKNRFGRDDLVFVSIVQSQSLTSDVKGVVEGINERNIGVVVFSLIDGEGISSQNVLGKGLLRHLKLTEVRFESFDLPNYLKSFTISLFLGVLFLFFLAMIGFAQALHPLTLLFIIALSMIIGHKIYKSRFHVTFTLNSDGFRIAEGQKLIEGYWADYDEAAIYVTSKRETCIRLYSKKGSVDLPISRTGLSRKEMYQVINRLIKGKDSRR